MVRARMQQAGGEGDGRAGGSATCGAAPARRGRRSRGPAHGGRGADAGAASADGGADAPALKPGTVYVLRGDKPVRVQVMTGLTDGTMTEIQSDALKEGDTIVVGLDVSSARPTSRRRRAWADRDGRARRRRRPAMNCSSVARGRVCRR